MTSGNSSAHDAAGCEQVRSEEDLKKSSEQTEPGYFVQKNVLIGYVMLVTVIVVMIALVTGFAVRSSCLANGPTGVTIDLKVSGRPAVAFMYR